MTVPFYIGSKGGMGLYTRGLSRHLVQRGHNVIVVTPYLQNVNFLLNGVRVIGVKSFYLPEWPFAWLKTFSIPFNLLSFFSILKNVIREYKIDLLNTHGQKYMITWLSVDYAFRTSLPSVLTIHGTDALKAYGNLAGAVDKVVNNIMFRETVRKVTAVLYDNDSQLSYWNKYHKNIQFFRYIQGIEISRFTSALNHKEKFREDYGIPKEKKVILFAGRLEAVKGISELLEAVEQVINRVEDVIFVIVGEGPLEKEVRSKASKFKDKFVFIPWVPYSQIQNIYAMSDLFVLPQKVEGQSRCLLEAIASNLHIVHTDLGGLPEIFKKYPQKTIISECSPSSIAIALIEALKNITKKKIIPSSPNRHLYKFGWTYATEQIEHLYESIIAKKFPENKFMQKSVS
jgi:1,2-diacylglycerol 3-alpha-glucosyltransferase